LPDGLFLHFGGEEQLKGLEKAKTYRRFRKVSAFPDFRTGRGGGSFFRALASGVTLIFQAVSFSFFLVYFLIRKVFLTVLLVFLILAPVVSLLVLREANNVMGAFSSEISSPSRIMGYNNTGMIVYDRQGQVIYQEAQARELKETAPLAEVPETLVKATLAIEDKDFYEHKGISFRGIARAIFSNIEEKDLYGQGASTITQQLARNTLLSLDKTYERKFKEIVLAIELEKRYSKDQILEMYLNTIYYGAGAHGIRDAAKIYFDKEFQELDLAESALLAGLPYAPSDLSPLGGNQEAAKRRQVVVLDKMVEYGYLSREEAEAAKSQELIFAPKKETLRYPHFVDYVKAYVAQRYGRDAAERGGFKIYTTLDSGLQNLGEALVRERVDQLRGYQVSNGALLALDPKTGQILAMVGSMNYFEPEYGSFNVLTGLRSPGSSIKPLVYAGAFENGMTAGTILDDTPKTIRIGGEVYRPKNSDGRFRGKVTVRRALANSLNIPAIEAGQRLGVEGVLGTFNKFGLTGLDDRFQYGPSIAIGGLEIYPIDLISAFGALANYGQKVESTPILKIENKYGEVIYEHQPQPQQIIDPRIAYILSDILSDNLTRREAFGYPNALEISRRAAAKTGTAEDFKNSWTIGYTPSLVVGAWMGNNDGSPMRGIWGSVGPANIWNRFMEQALAGQPEEWFDRPVGITEAIVCETGKRELFLSGTEPKPCSPPPAASRPAPTAGPAEKPDEKPEKEEGRPKPPDPSLDRPKRED
jgi:1A family penicillin-binding protein